jgi:hypothetical protein
VNYVGVPGAYVGQAALSKGVRLAGELTTRPSRTWEYHCVVTNGPRWVRHLQSTHLIHLLSSIAGSEQNVV